MFRAQQNAFDDAIGTPAISQALISIADLLVAKATDENLTSENWELIMVSLFKAQRSIFANRTRMSATELQRRTRGMVSHQQCDWYEYLRALSVQCQRRGSLIDQAPRAPERQRTAIHLGGQFSSIETAVALLNMIARKCAVAKLRCQDAYRACVSKLHGCAVTACRRQSRQLPSAS